ncbi:uncharacterized protein TNCV_1510581 [Trichonephila clavipes]|nr:uncharacterized protein TNCV_1510581 [Trichonephila clavipes]
MAFLEKAKKQDLVLLAEELGQKVSDKMTNIELRNIIIGSKDYEEEFVRDQLSVILEERFERESEEKIARQLAIEEEKIARQHAIQQLRWESELNELRLEIESIRSNVKRTSCAEDRKKTSSNYRISIGRAEEHVRETSPAVLMAEATIPVTTPIKEEKGMDDLRVVYVKVKGEQEMVNAVIDTGAQMPVVRPDVVEGQSINNRGSIQITSAFGEHEMGEVKDSNMELNDFRHGVVPVSKNLVNDMLICSSDYEVFIENSQMIRNPAKLREPSKKEGIISSTDSKSVCSQEVVTDLLPETQSLLNVPNGDLVAVKINGSNVQTNGQGIKESKGEVVLTCEFKKESCIVLGVVAPQGKRQCEIVRLLNVPRQIVSDAICRFEELGNDVRRLGSGRKRTVNISRNRKAIEKGVQRNLRVSMRQIARDMGISDRSVRRIAKMKLGLKPYKWRKVQLLTGTALEKPKTFGTVRKSVLGEIPVH